MKKAHLFWTFNETITIGHTNNTIYIVTWVAREDWQGLDGLNVFSRDNSILNVLTINELFSSRLNIIIMLMRPGARVVVHFGLHPHGLRIVYVFSAFTIVREAFRLIEIKLTRAFIFWRTYL